MNTSESIRFEDKARTISWAIFDSAVYIHGYGPVVKWDPVSKTPESTVYKDIHFSPDGTYYLHGPEYEHNLPIQLYRTMDGRNVSDILPANLGTLSGWVFNSGHFLLYTKVDAIVETAGEGPVKAVKSRKVRSAMNFVYDPEQRKVVKEFEGVMSSWVGDGSRIIVEKDDKVLFEDIR